MIWKKTIQQELSTVELKKSSNSLYTTFINNSTALNTNVLLSNSFSSETQMFCVEYLGDNKYLFEPYNSNAVKLYMSNSTKGTHMKLNTSSNATSTQGFCVTALNPSQYTISTSIRSFGRVLNNKYDSTLG